jgi:hypothetical protein
VKLFIEWGSPIPLRDGTKQNLIYTLDLKKLPQVPGLYILGRRWGKEFEALYVGKAVGIRGRVKNQLNNLRLMQHLRNARGGSRVVIPGKILTKPGQQLEKTLVTTERALIRHFLSTGDDLVNKQGTRLRHQEVHSSGKRPKRFIPHVMFLERGRND